MVTEGQSILVSRTNGSVQEWYNQGGPDIGPNAGKVGWWGRGTIARGLGNDGKGVLFADLNGDKRAEYCDVDASSSAMKGVAECLRKKIYKLSQCCGECIVN